MNDQFLPVLMSFVFLLGFLIGKINRDKNPPVSTIKSHTKTLKVCEYHSGYLPMGKLAVVDAHNCCYCPAKSA